MAFFWTFINFLIDIFSAGLFGALLIIICIWAGACYGLVIIKETLTKD